MTRSSTKNKARIILSLTDTFVHPLLNSGRRKQICNFRDTGSSLENIPIQPEDIHPGFHQLLAFSTFSRRQGDFRLAGTVAGGQAIP